MSPVSVAHSASPLAYAPASACVCVTARCDATRWSTVAPAAAASDESALAVIATHGRPAARCAISTTSRNSPDEETASTASPGRHANRSRTAIPHGTATIGGPGAPLSSAASHSACAT